MQLHQIKPTQRRSLRKRIGRGGKRGTYSGRGLKGQKARAGGRPRPELRDILKRIPKRRGWKQKPTRMPARVVNLRDLQRLFADGEAVTARELERRGLIGRSPRGLSAWLVKILGGGGLTKKLTVKGGIVASASAREAIERAGGSVIGTMP